MGKVSRAPAENIDSLALVVGERGINRGVRMGIAVAAAVQAAQMTFEAQDI
jgi:hypothetical protein